MSNLLASSPRTGLRHLGMLCGGSLGLPGSLCVSDSSSLASPLGERLVHQTRATAASKASCPLPSKWVDALARACDRSGRYGALACAQAKSVFHEEKGGKHEEESGRRDELARDQGESGQLK
jgi:hypothetical protein